MSLEQDRGNRFALWAMLFMLGSAPDLEAAFEDEDGGEAALGFMDLLASANGDESGA